MVLVEMLLVLMGSNCVIVKEFEKKNLWLWKKNLEVLKWKKGRLYDWSWGVCVVNVDDVVVRWEEVFIRMK